MAKNTHFALNPKKCYQVRNQDNGIKHVPSTNWKQDLIEFLKRVNREKGLGFVEAEIVPHLERHLGGTSSSYQLSGLLSFISDVVNKKIADPASFKYDPENDAAQIASTLLEGLPNCNAGLYERAQSLVQNFTTRMDLYDVLQVLRHEIVDSLARKEIRNSHGMQVHEHDFFFIAASDAGYGVNASRKYYKEASRTHMNKVEAAFTTQYTPLMIIKYVENILWGRFLELDVINPKHEISYEKAVQCKGLLEQYLDKKSLAFRECFLFSSPVDDEEEEQITGINWGYIRQAISEALLEKGIINHHAFSTNRQLYYPDINNKDECVYWFKAFASPELFFEYKQFLISSEYSIFCSHLLGSEDEEVLNRIVSILKSDKAIFQDLSLDKMFIQGLRDALRAASNIGHTQIVKALLESAQDDEHLLKEMLLAGSSKDGSGLALQIACRNGHTETVKALLESAQNDEHLLKEMLLAGNSTGGSGLALQIACQNGHTEIVKALLESAQNDEPLLKEMLLAGNSKDGLGLALRRACQIGHTQIVRALLKSAQNDEPLLKEMLLAGNSKDGSRFALRLACQNGHTEIVKALLESAQDDKDLLKEMLLAGNSKDGVGPALRIACEKGHTEIVKALLEKDFFNELDTLDNKTVYQMVTKPEVLSALIKYNPYGLVSFLNVLNEKNLMPYLKKINQLDSSTKKIFADKLVNKIKETTLSDSSMNLDGKIIQEIYASKSGLLSMFRVKLKSMHNVTPTSMLELLAKRASKDIEGASIKTLLQLTKNRISSKTTSSTIYKERLKAHCARLNIETIKALRKCSKVLDEDERKVIFEHLETTNEANKTNKDKLSPAQLDILFGEFGLFLTVIEDIIKGVETSNKTDLFNESNIAKAIEGSGPYDNRTYAEVVSLFNTFTEQYLIHATKGIQSQTMP